MEIKWMGILSKISDSLPTIQITFNARIHKGGYFKSED